MKQIIFTQVKVALQMRLNFTWHNDIELLYYFLELLKGADLSKLTSKKVRKQLEDKFDEDLTAR